MENQSAFEYAMQIIIDHNQLIDDAEKAYREIQRIFESPIRLSIEGDAKFNEAVRAIQRFEQAIEQLQQNLVNVDTSLENIEVTTPEAMEEMAAAAKHAGKSVAQLTKELEAAKDELEELFELMERLEEGDEAAAEAFNERFGSHRNTSSLDKYSEHVLKVNERVNELESALKALSKTGGQVVEQASDQAAKSAAAFVNTFQRKFGVSTAELDVLIRTERMIQQIEGALSGRSFQIRIDKKALRKEIQSALDDVSTAGVEKKLLDSLEKQAKTIRTFFEGVRRGTTGRRKDPLKFTPSVDTKAFADSLADLQRLLEAFRGAAADGAVLKVRLDVDQKQIRETVKRINDLKPLKDGSAKLRLSIDRARLRNDVVAAIKELNKQLDVKLQIGADIAQIAPAALSEVKGIARTLAKAVEGTRQAVTASRAGGSRGRRIVVAGAAMPTFAEWRKANPNADSSLYRRQVEEALEKGIVPPNMREILRRYPKLAKQYAGPLESAFRRYDQEEALRRDAQRRAQDRRLEAEAREAARREQQEIDRRRRREERQLEREFERNRQRRLMALKAQARDDARHRPLTWLTRRFPRLHELQDSVRTIQSVYDPGLDDEELKRRTQAAIQVASTLRQQLADLQFAAYSPEEKELLKVFGESFVARYVTGLENRVKQVRDRGPSANVKGALRGVDLLARDQMLAEWQARAAAMSAELQRAATYIGGFGEQHVDQWQEALKSFTQYKNSVLRFQKEMAALDIARETGQEAEQLARIQKAKAAVDRAEAAMRLQVLGALGGEVSIPEIIADDQGVRFGAPVSMSKFHAYNQMTEAMRRILGADFDALNVRRMDSGRRALSFREFAAGLFSGNREILRQFLEIKGHTAEVLNDHRKMREELERQLGPLNQIKQAWMSIDDEIESGITRARLIDQARRGTGTGVWGAYGRTIRNAFALFGGIGLGYTAAWQIQAQMREYMAFEQVLADLRGVVGGSLEQMQNLGVTIGQSAARWGYNLVTTAEAARVLAQAGLDVFKELDATLMGARGLGITIEQMQELQVTIAEITRSNDRYTESVNWTLAVLDKISTVERQFATSTQDLANAIQLLSPVMENFTDGALGMVDAFDFTIGAVTTVVDRLRISGNQAARSIQMMLSRLSMPEVARKLQEDFGARIATPDGKSYLPFDLLLQSLAQRYQELKRESPAMARQFAVQLAGGRQVNVVTTLLENVDKVLRVSTISANAFADAQIRAEMATETLNTAVTRLHTNFQLWIRNLMQATHFGQGLTNIMGGLADVMGGVSGTGAGAPQLIATVLTIGATYKAMSNLYSLLSMSRKPGTGGDLFGAMVDAGKAGVLIRLLSRVERGSGLAAKSVGGLTTALGALARMFTPGGVLLAGLITAVSLFGVLGDESEKALDRYRVAVRDLEDLKVWESPQYQEMMAIAAEMGYQRGRDLYDTVVARTIGPEASAVMKELLSQAPEAIKASGEEFDKWRNAVVRAFIEQIPDAHRRMYESLETDSQRLVQMTREVGLAAWAANAQITASIADMHETVTLMIQDTVRGIDSIFAANRKGAINRLIGQIQDSIKGVVSAETDLLNIYNTQVTKYVTATGRSGLPVRGLSEDTAQQRAFEDVLEFVWNSLIQQMTPEIGTIFRRAPVAQDFVDRTVREALARSPEQLPAYEIFKAVWQAILDDEQLSRAYQAAMAEATGDYDLAARLYPAIYADAKLSPQEEIARLAREASARAGDAVITEFMKVLEDRFPQAKALRELDELLRRPGAAGITEMAGAAEQARQVIARFRDGLLNLVESLYEAMRRYQFDRDFAQRFGLGGFDESQALIQMGQMLLRARADLYTRSTIDLTNIQQQIATLRERTIQAGAGEDRLTASEREREKLENEFKQVQTSIQDFVTKDLAEIIGADSAMYKELMQGLGEIASVALEARADALDTFVERVATAMVERGKELAALDRERRYNLEIEKALMEHQHRLLEAQLPITATLAQRSALRQRIAEEEYLHQRRALEVQKDRLDANQHEIDQEIRKLDILYQQTRLHEAQMDRAKARTALDQQIMSNMSSAFSGVRRTLTDLSIWEAVIDPEGDDPETRAKNRAEAIGRVIVDTLQPFFQTIQDRLFDNVYQNILDSLMGSDTIQYVFGEFVEMRLRADLMTADTLERSWDSGREILYWGLLQAFHDGRQILLGADPSGIGTSVLKHTGVLPEGASITILTPAQGEATDQDAAQEAAKAVLSDPQFKQFRNMQYAVAGGMVVGGLAGAWAGGGGRYAQFGAQAGSTLAGMFAPGLVGALGLAGPLGLLAGGAITALGGLFGGWLGRKADKDKEKDTPVVKGLEAVERAQKETIEVIKQGNEALLKPDSRLMNLPTSFRIPVYMPNFGPGGGAGRTVTRVQQNNQVTIQIHGGDLDEVRQVVVETVEDLLYTGRHSSSWNVGIM